MVSQMIGGQLIFFQSFDVQSITGGQSIDNI